MVKCESYYDCNSHGDCIKSFCKCDTGWFGNNCTITGSEEWGQAWATFKSIFIILYFILFAFSLLKLYRVMRSDLVLSLPRLLLRMFRSPKNLSLIFICCVSLLRGIWLSGDPFSFLGQIGRIGDRMLYELVFPFLYGMYSCVLLVWGGLYQGMSSKKADPYRILRKCYLWVMILAFPVSIMLILIKGYRVEEQIWFTLGTILLGSGVLLIVIGFVVFGLLMLCYVKKSDANIRNVDSREVEINTQGNRMTLETIHTKRKTMSDRNSNELNSNEMFEPNENFERNREVEHDWWNSFDSEIANKYDSLLKKQSTLFIADGPNIKREYTHCILNLTKEDRRVFTQIVVLSSLSGFLGGLILALFIIFTVSDAGSDQKLTISALYISFFLEFSSCCIILIVFTTQIKVSSKERLKFSSKILFSKQHEEPVLSYPVTLSSIGKRLYFYFS